jgi:tetratricopeptide (TPR) repeat protein
MINNSKTRHMKKVIFLLFAAIVTVSGLTAQTIEEGIKHLNYKKNKSATDVFKKLYDANSKDAQNIYWYGQTLMANEDVKGAKAIYQKALQEGVNDAWILIGMGHVEIIEGGDMNAVKQKFEQAITMTTETKGKNKNKPNPAILNAIGRANADGSSKQGDPTYAIDKLKQAAALDVTNADIMINMGINYLKLGGDQGGEAVKAYQEAIARDPKNALAMYKIGLIYKSQDNKPLFEQWFTDAIKADPTFPLPYLAYYEYYANRDVNVAKGNIESYLQYADKDCEADFLYADYLFRAGNYQESINKATSMSNGECKSYYQLPLLFAYNYDRLNDSIQAKVNVEKYFSTTAPDKIVPENYDIAVKVFSRFPGSEGTTVSYFQKAIDNDTSIDNKVKYSKQAAEIMGKAKMYKERLKWLQSAIKLKGGTMSELDYYQFTNTSFNSKDFDGALEIAKKYVEEYPTKPQPYYFLVRAAKAIDTSATLGTAVEPILQQNDYLLKDTALVNVEKNKKAVFNNYYYLLKFYNDVQKETQKAIEITDKMLVLYPNVGGEENTFATQTKDALTKSLNKSGGKSTSSKPSGK